MPVIIYTEVHVHIQMLVIGSLVHVGPNMEVNINLEQTHVWQKVCKGNTCINYESMKNLLIYLIKGCMLAIPAYTKKTSGNGRQVGLYRHNTKCDRE